MLQLRWQPWRGCVSLLSVQDSHVGRDRLYAGAEGATAPETLRQTDRV